MRTQEISASSRHVDARTQTSLRTLTTLAATTPRIQTLATSDLPAEGLSAEQGLPDVSCHTGHAQEYRLAALTGQMLASGSLGAAPARMPDAH